MQSLSLGTYNAGLIQVRVFGKTLFEFAPYVPIRAKAISKVIRNVNCDVFCLQEVFEKEHANLIINDLKDIYPYYYFPRTKGIKIFDTGLGILSKHPLIENEVHIFKSQLLEEKILAPKGFLSTYISLPNGKPIHLLTSHTTAGGSRHHPESKISDICRDAQLKELFELATLSVNDVAATFVTGDLNCGPEASSINYKKMLNYGFIDIVAKASCFSDKSNISWDPLNSLNRDSPHQTSPKQRIDHIFLLNNDKEITVPIFQKFGTDSNVFISENLYVTPSDHYGFAVKIELL